MGSRDNSFSMPKLLTLKKVYMSMMHHWCVISVRGGGWGRGEWSCHLLRWLTNGKVVVSVMSFLRLRVCEQTGRHFWNLDVPGIFHSQIPSEAEDRKRLLGVQQELGSLDFFLTQEGKLGNRGLKMSQLELNLWEVSPVLLQKLKMNLGPFEPNSM